MKTTRTCSIIDCARPVFARGWCGRHWYRWRQYGDPIAGSPLRQQWDAICSVAGCDRPHTSLGYCRAHYMRVWQRGDPRADRSVRTFGDEPGYHAAHYRIYNLRGRADDYLCQHCGETALEWAYTNDCPDERVSPESWRYSLDPARYMPLCKPCHVRFDREARIIT